MTPQSYIEEQLAKLRLPAAGHLTADEIYRLLISKKFRKYSVNPEYQEHIRNAIALNISKNEPIKLTFVFGGYKLWRLEEAPEADWAELFSCMYYAHWLAPVCAGYAPGVWFDFYSDDAILETMDNVPKAETEAYLKSFRDLLAFLKRYLPANFSFTLNRVAEQYPSEAAFLEELEQLKNTILVENGGKLSSIPDDVRATIDLNIKLRPEQETDPLWREKVFLTHEAYAQVSKRRPYYRTSDKIMLITRPVKNTLAVGTTKTSVMKFWIGAGILERRADGFIENIYSPNQLASHSFATMAMKMTGLTGKNFSSIRVVE